MLEPEHTGVEQPVLYMTEHEPGLIELRTLSAPRGPAPQPDRTSPVSRHGLWR